jgi:hypothetical protein
MKIKNTKNKKTSSKKVFLNTQAEIEKCINSPVYFYNKYLKKEWQKELTESEYQKFTEEIKQKQTYCLD